MNPVFQKAQELASIEKQLDGDLTLSQIDEIAEQIGRVGAAALPLFDRLEEKRIKLQDKQVALFDQSYALLGDVAKISLIWERVSPEEMAEELISLHGRVAELSEGAGQFPEVEAIVLEAKKQLQIAHFAFVFPVAMDLKKMVEGMKQTAEKIRSSNSLADFQMFNSTQQQYILAGGA